MEELTLSPRACARPVRLPMAEPAAWRAPSVSRFDSRAANDGPAETEFTLAEIPRWAIVVGGGTVAALMGALLGGALAV